VCGVRAILNEGNGGGDANMRAGAQSTVHLAKACGGQPAVRFDFPSGSIRVSADNNTWGVGPQVIDHALVGTTIETNLECVIVGRRVGSSLGVLHHVRSDLRHAVRDLREMTGTRESGGREISVRRCERWYTQSERKDGHR